jgi:hypothetical protein
VFVGPSLLIRFRPAKRRVPSGTALVFDPPRSPRLDAMGVFLSVACLVHCSVPAILIGAMPAVTLSAAVGHELHGVLAVLVLLVAALSLVPGYRLHRRRATLVLGGSGVAALCLGALLPHAASLGTATLVTVSGSALVVTAHVLNLRCTRVHATRTLAPCQRGAASSARR